MEAERPKLRKNPYEKVSFLSKICFFWLNPLLKEGWKRELQIEDLYEAVDSDRSQHLGERLEKEWKKELDKKSLKRTPSFIWALTRTFGPEVAAFGILAFFEDAMKVIQPVLLGKIVNYFGPGGGGVSTFEVYMYSLGLLGGSMTLALTHHPYFFYLQRTGMRIRVACCSLIYKKTLRLSHTSLMKTTPGQIVNLLSNDVLKFDNACLFLHYLWIGPLEACAAVLILWYYVGPASLAGFALLLLFVPLQIVTGNLFSKFRLATAKRTDTRVQVMYEILAGIKVIKMYCWEKPFSALIGAARSLELKEFWKKCVTDAVWISTSESAPKWCLTIVLIVWFLSSSLSVDRVFVALGLTVVWRRSTRYLSLGVGDLATVKVVAKRIQTFLLLDEVDFDALSCPLRPKPQNREVTIDNLSAKWDSNATNFTLDSISLSVRAGEVLAVVGPVGAGKSSLLMTILGELPPVSGQVTTRGRIAYTAQVPWVFSATVRQNITFGAEWDPRRFSRALELSAFDHDVALLPRGDATLIGERGVTLSGGQRARLALARTLYSSADIYLLDDPLSAVDAAVGKHLFEQTIRKALKPYPVILVTHQLQLLQKVDKILVLKEGKIIATGTYKQLAGSGVDFTELLQTPGEEREEVHKSTVPTLSQLLLDANLYSSMDVQQPDPCSRSHPVLPMDKLFISQTHLRLTQSASYRVGHPELNSLISLAAGDDAFVGETHEAELRAQGNVSWRTYYDYFTAGAHPILLCLLGLLWGGTQGVYVLTDWWMADWAARDEQAHLTTLDFTNYTNFQSSPPSADDSSNYTQINIDQRQYDPGERNWYLYVYLGLIFLFSFLVTLRTLGLFKVCVSASRSLHEQMFASVVRAPMRFFDMHPVGRILNRFSKDIGQMDDLLPSTVYDVFAVGLQIIGTIVVVCIVNPWVILAVIPIFAAFVFLAKYYLATSRDIKRLEGIVRSPLYSHLSSSLTGLYTVRSLNAGSTFCEEFDMHQDVHTAASFTFIALSRWLAVLLDWICVLFLICVLLPCLLAKDSLGLDSPSVGLSLSYTLSLMGIFQWAVRQSAAFENQMVSAERVLEYRRLTPEAPLYSTSSSKPQKSIPHIGVSVAISTSSTQPAATAEKERLLVSDQNGTHSSLKPTSENGVSQPVIVINSDEQGIGANGIEAKPRPNNSCLALGDSQWPQKGEIVFRDVSLRYAAELPLILSGLNFTLKSMEKVGIVGRTGAGKSSLLTLLFRMAEPEPESSLTIDNVDITHLGLHDLRSRISIIPQDPFLFAGSVRRNLDPFGELSDSELVASLRDVELLEAVIELQRSSILENGFEEEKKGSDDVLTCIAGKSSSSQTKMAAGESPDSSPNAENDTISGVNSAVQSGKQCTELSDRKGKHDRASSVVIDRIDDSCHAGSDSSAGPLDAVIQEGGANLSVGQRQLICLARAVLRKNRVLVIDEATANVDPRTDALIQQTIRSKFHHCTVLTIAHRLHTVMDSDRILVMESGKAIEFDTPTKLLKDSNSALYKLAASAGEAQLDMLKEIASKSTESE